MALLGCVLAQAKFDLETLLFMQMSAKIGIVLCEDVYEYVTVLLPSIIFSVVSVGGGDAAK